MRLWRTTLGTFHFRSHTQPHADFRSPCSAPRRTPQFGMKISFTNTRSLSLRSATTLGTFHPFPSRIRAVRLWRTTLGTFLELVKYAIGALCLERIVTPYPNKMKISFTNTRSPIKQREGEGECECDFPGTKYPHPHPPTHTLWLFPSRIPAVCNRRSTLGTFRECAYCVFGLLS